jgi:hypothetical protein
LSPKMLSRLLFYTQHVPVDSGSPQEASMALDSDDVLEVFTILVWATVLMLFLVAVARLNVLYDNEPSNVINVLPAS